MSTSAVPSDWQIAKLEVCVDILDSQRVPVNNKERQARIQNKAPDELYPYFGATGEVGKIDGYLFDEELVALGEDGVPFLDPRKPKAYKLSGKTWVNNHAHVLKAIEGLTTNQFLLHYLNQFDYQEYVNGGTRLKLTQANMRRMPFPVPPLAEQKVIADKLDTLLAQVENTKARLERIPQILKRFRQSVLAAAVSGRLTEEWRALHDLEEDSWSSMPLKNIAEVLDPNPSHRYPKPEYGGIPILSTQQFDGYSGWTTDKAKHVSRDFFDERKGKCGFYEDDIIFARKGRLGLARFAPKGFDYVYSHTVFIVRPHQNMNPAFLLWSLRPDSVVDHLLMAMNSNTGVPTLGKGVFEKMEVNVPSPEEQTEIVRRVDQLFAHADRIEQQVNNALARVNNLTQSILAKAFRGELTEQWRKDNPELISGENSAEALLERIKAERAAAQSAKKTRKKVQS